MHSLIRQHVIRETLTSTLINSLFSFTITLLLLGGNEVIARQALVIDAIPQSFFVTFFSVLIPTWLTRKKIRGNKLPTLPFRQTWLPFNGFLRAVCFGVIVAIAGAMLHLVVLSVLQVNQLGIGTIYVYKTIYGAMLSVLVTPYALMVALKETGTTS